jgi:hypothetical protein
MLTRLGRTLALMLAGMLVAFAAIYGRSLVSDLLFLHQARLSYETQKKAGPPK